MLEIGSVVRVSETATGGDATRGNSTDLRLSSDGKSAVFVSAANNLVAGDTNNAADIFLKDLETGAVERVNVNEAGEQSDGFNLAASNPLYDAAAGLVYFSSRASNLIPDQPNVTQLDFYVKNLNTGEVELVSANEAGEAFDSATFGQVLSPDNQFLVFTTAANNVLATEVPEGSHSYIKNLVTGEIELLHTTTQGDFANASLSNISFSEDGTKIAFHSGATDLTDDTLPETAFSQVYVKDLVTGDVTLVSQDASSVADQSSTALGFSADGDKILFSTQATNLIEGSNGFTNLYVKDLDSGAVQPVSITEDGVLANNNISFASLSADGTKVAFISNDSALNGDAVPLLVNYIYVKDLVTGELTQLLSPVTGEQFNNRSFDVDFSNDSNQLLVSTLVSNLIEGDRNARTDTYIIDLFNPDENILGDENDNTISGGEGDDTINGLQGNDEIDGGVGQDSLIGWSGDDIINGGDDNDRILGGSGNDTLFGGDGDDYLSAHKGEDILSGGDGNDTLRGGLGDDTLSGDAGNDRLIGKEGNDQINGNDGNDTVRGGEGNDTIDGMEGDDRLLGDAGDDLLSGGNGKDRVFGGEGNDTLTGGLGRDVLFGNDGADIYDFNSVLESQRGSADVLKDFEVGVDQIDISDLGFSGIYDGGVLAIDELRVIYNENSDRTYIRNNDTNFDIIISGDVSAVISADDFIF